MGYDLYRIRSLTILDFKNPIRRFDVTLYLVKGKRVTKQIPIQKNFLFSTTALRPKHLFIQKS